MTDELLTHSDATVAIVDRRPAPGGHWLDAYPFVRLHQPSAFYGVSSAPLGQDAIDRSGFNAGFHELASADKLRSYYAQLMRQSFIPSSRVQFFPCSEYLGGEQDRHAFSSCFTGARQEVRVRCKVVDTTYLQGSVPATGAPPFEVASGVRWCVPGALARMDHRPSRYVVIGAGKTALDTCVWLLEQGVAPAAIRWIKPREAWWLNRRFFQPRSGLPQFYAGVAMQLQAFVEAGTVEDVFLRLESEGLFLRVDRSVLPSMMHGAIIGELETQMLRRIEDVVRLGHVRRIEPDRIVLDEGEVPTDADALHVHCAARGIAYRPVRPIFESARITVQPCMYGFASFQFAMIGALEAVLGTDEEKNRLCRPITYWDRSADYLKGYLALLAGEQLRAGNPAVAAWSRGTRLNALAGLGQFRDDPLVTATREFVRQFAPSAGTALQRLLASVA